MTLYGIEEYLGTNRVWMSIDDICENGKRLESGTMQDKRMNVREAEHTTGPNRGSGIKLSYKNLIEVLGARGVIRT